MSERNVVTMDDLLEAENEFRTPHSKESMLDIWRFIGFVQDSEHIFSGSHHPGIRAMLLRELKARILLREKDITWDDRRISIYGGRMLLDGDAAEVIIIDREMGCASYRCRLINDDVGNRIRTMPIHDDVFDLLIKVIRELESEPEIRPKSFKELVYWLKSEDKRRRLIWTYKKMKKKEE